MNSRPLRNFPVKVLPFVFTLTASTASFAQDAGANPNVEKPNPAQPIPPPVAVDQGPLLVERRPAPPVGPPPFAFPRPAVDRCEGGWEAAYAKVREATVKIENAKGTATGFIYGDGRHIITSYRAIDDNREFVVTFANGEKTDARVVDVDEDDDLAILVAPNARPKSAALTARGGGISPGLPVGLVGHPFATFGERLEENRGLLVWSLSTGVVSAANERSVQYDAATNAGNTGGPLFDCSGALVGMVSRSVPGANGVNFATGAPHVQRLYERAASGNGRTYAGKWRFEHFSLNLLFGFHKKERPVGLGFGLDLSYADRLVLHGDIGALWDDNDSLFHTWDRRRDQGALTVGYRFALSSKPAFPMKLTLAAGGFGQHVTRTDDWGIATATNCGAGVDCPVTLTRREDKSSEFRILPALTADLHVWNRVRVAYTFASPFRHFTENHHHTVAVGIVF